tara:strand:+ start:43929 stop:44150 length:222 start_codon:yes stop_codon:yes gene_type:complete
MKDFSRWLILLGIIAIAIGFFLNFFAEKLGWLGKLPGDIRLGSKNIRFYFPFTSLVLLNLLFYIIVRVINWLK